MPKDFDRWINVKKDLDNKNKLPSIKEGEIWWCSVGENVGVEIGGKSKVFTRPVLIYKKLSRFGFMGVPLTSKNHTENWYVKFVFKNRISLAALSQARVFSVARLHKRMGTISGQDFKLIERKFNEIYIKNYPQPDDWGVAGNPEYNLIIPHEKNFVYNNNMNQSFFFYDLETSGLNPREDRIMQFAGQRTSLDLEPMGKPVNILVRLSDDALPTWQRFCF